MEKILVAINADKPEPATLDFACYLARLTGSKVTGLFLENIVADDHFVLKEEPGTVFSSWSPDEQSLSYQQRMKAVDHNISLFRSSCESRGVQCAVHLNPREPSEEVIRESRYADVLVIDGRTSFAGSGEEIPTGFAREVLKRAECPVLIAPENFQGIDEIIFTWDGSSSSMFAIKQFCNLFPQLDDQKISVLSVTKEGAAIDDEDTRKFREWISGHYSSIGYYAKEGDTETVLLASLFKKKNVLIVMGAYGRSAISQFFHRSKATFLIQTLTQGLFIAHP